MQRTFIFVFVASIAIVSMARSQTVDVQARPASVPHLDEGVVEGHTYKNTSLGLEFTTADHLKLGTPELKGKQGTVPLLVTVGAWGELRSSARDGTIFYADALAYYPDTQRTTEAYVRKVDVGNRNEGFERVESEPEGKIGETSFARSDFEKGIVHEAVLVKAGHAFALVFIFAGPDVSAVNKLIAATKLKIN
jgi:hypothetical protein